MKVDRDPRPDCVFFCWWWLVTVTHILRHASYKACLTVYVGAHQRQLPGVGCIDASLWSTNLKPEADFYESEEYLNISVFLRWWHVMLVDCTWSEIHSSTMQIQMTPGWMFLLEEVPSMLIHNQRFRFMQSHREKNAWNTSNHMGWGWRYFAWYFPHMAKTQRSLFSRTFWE